MERLTNKHEKDYGIKPLDEKCICCSSCDRCEDHLYEIFQKLGAYEDTGKTPEQVAEWAKAEQEGRLVVLLCKVGDEIFSFRWSAKNQKYEVHTGKVKSVRYESSDGVVTVSDGERYCIWGKTVFLTREAAEAVLKEE